jgi:hypothetical protein
MKQHKKYATISTIIRKKYQDLAIDITKRIQGPPD